MCSEFYVDLEKLVFALRHYLLKIGMKTKVMTPDHLSRGAGRKDVWRWQGPRT